MRSTRRHLFTLAFVGASLASGAGCSSHSDQSTGDAQTGGAPTGGQAGQGPDSTGTESTAAGTESNATAAGSSSVSGQAGANSMASGGATALAQGGLGASAGIATGQGGLGLAGQAGMTTGPSVVTCRPIGAIAAAGAGGQTNDAGVAGQGSDSLAVEQAGAAGQANDMGTAGQDSGGQNTGGRTGASSELGFAGRAAFDVCPAESAIVCLLSGAAVCANPPKDTDCDGIPDPVEIGPNGKAPRDTDGDGVADYLDLDSDNDGIADRIEVGDFCNLPRDADGDGVPDYRDADSDANGILDELESRSDPDNDGLPDFADNDDDGDFILDVAEIGTDPKSPVDTDNDGIPDYKDVDSDNDTISDRDERANDADSDGVPNYRDLDSDADGIADALEAGDAILATPPVDTDKDALPDFLDLDSDGDGILDAVEDANHNGVLDPGETSRVKADTDGDGVNDLIEIAAATDPNNPNDSPVASGNYLFVVPYQKPPTPSKGTLDFATKISAADIFLLVDTTRSMDGEIANLQQSLSNLIIPRLAADIDSIAIGVGSYRDFPTSPFGSTGDWPFRLEHRIMTVRTTAGVASLQTAVNTLSAGGGNDYYEASWEALHQVAKGTGNSSGGAKVAAFDPNNSVPPTIPPGESVGSIPGVGFRQGALPIAVLFTDAPGHNTDSPMVTACDYTASAGVTSAHSTQTIAELKAISARLVGVSSGTPDARDDELAAITMTGSNVPTTAWGTGTSRPAGCAANQCCTGLSGAGEAPDTSSRCPLAFRMSTDGSGLGAAVVTAIEVLTTYGVMDVSARPVDDPSDSVDAVAAFIDGIVANPSAGPPCDSGLTAEDRDGDGRLDTFTKVLPGKRVCFDIIPKTNRTVPGKEEPQKFKASVTVLGDGVTVVDTRGVYFLVPPATPQ